jgi:hypothetical protein
VPSNNEGIVSLRQIFFPSAELTLVARRAAFFVGDAPGPPDAPPDFADSHEEVTAGMASIMRCRRGCKQGERNSSDRQADEALWTITRCFA